MEKERRKCRPAHLASLANLVAASTTSWLMLAKAFRLLRLIWLQPPAPEGVSRAETLAETVHPSADGSVTAYGNSERGALNEPRELDGLVRGKRGVKGSS